MAKKDDEELRGFYTYSDPNNPFGSGMVPDLKHVGFYAPKYEEQPTKYIEGREALKTRKKVGGILSIVIGGILVAFYFIFLMTSISEADYYPEYTWSVIVSLAGFSAGAAILLGGILGLALVNRAGAIIALIGTLAGLIFAGVFLYLFTGAYYVLIPEIIVYVLVLPCYIVGFVSSIVLLVATQKAYFID